MKVFVLNPKGKAKKMPKRKKSTKKTAARRRRRRAPAKKTTARRRRRRAPAKKTTTRRRRRRNPTRRSAKSWGADAGYGLLGMVASGISASVVQLGTEMLSFVLGDRFGQFMTSPITAGGGTSTLLGSQWSPAQYLGGALMSWKGDAFLPKRTKPSSVSAFRAGATFLPLGKLAFTEVLPRLPAIPMLSDAGFGSVRTVGYDSNGQAWLRQGNGYAAMQGMVGALQHKSPMDGLVEANAYDSARWAEPVHTEPANSEPVMDSAMGSF